jgi:hypothetical protein
MLCPCRQHPGTGGRRAQGGARARARQTGRSGTQRASVVECSEPEARDGQWRARPRSQGRHGPSILFRLAQPRMAVRVIIFPNKAGTYPEGPDQMTKHAPGHRRCGLRLASFKSYLSRRQGEGRPAGHKLNPWRVERKRKLLRRTPDGQHLRRRRQPPAR